MSECPTDSATSLDDFNPTLVQLEYDELKAQIIKMYHFNPTLVQLELKRMMAIKREIIDFNPTLVQLEYLRLWRQTVERTKISIPHWCN